MRLFVIAVMATEGWLSESVLRELYAQLFTTSARSTERPGEFNAQWVTNTVCCIREDESEGLPKTSAIAAGTVAEERGLGKLNARCVADSTQARTQLNNRLVSCLEFALQLRSTGNVSPTWQVHLW